MRILLTLKNIRLNSLLSPTNFHNGLITPTLCYNISVSSELEIRMNHNILTLAVWIGLETLGFGANLQHYNPLIDAALSDAFGIPREHRLVGQLVFGSIEAPPKEKSHMAVEKRLQVIGSK